MKPGNIPHFVYGLHTVRAVLEHQPTRGKKLFAARSADVEELKRLASLARIPVEQVDRALLEKRFLVGSDAQGVVLLVAPFPYVDLDEMDLRSIKRILILDSWQDAANVGRAARAALSFGADLMVICKDRSAQVTPAAEKSAVGALAQVPVARVVNLIAAIKKMKEANFFVYGADEHGDMSIKTCDFADKVALVIGQEGKGLRDLTKKNCDVLVSIPMAGREICLNAADTAVVFLYEISTR
jgi:23S rRNA (guanosine2251-2'-O)-methyltransferase